MKKAIKIGGALVVLLIIGLVVGYFFLGSIIKTGVETVGPDLTQGDVKLESASLSVFGSGGVKGLEIGNPKNADFSSPYAFKLGEAFISVNIGSISSDKIVINEILIDGAELYWEGLTGDNHQKILENIESYTGPSDPADGKPKEDEPAGDGPQKSLEIKKFTMSNTKVHLYGFGKKLAEVSLPNFSKEGIGSGGDVKANESIALLYEAMLGSVSQLVKDSKDIIGDSWGKLSESGSKAVDGIKEAGEGVVDGIKGLFK